MQISSNVPAIHRRPTEHCRRSPTQVPPTGFGRIHRPPSCIPTPIMPGLPHCPPHSPPRIGPDDVLRGPDLLDDELKQLQQDRRDSERLTNDRGNGMSTFMAIPPSARELELLQQQRGFEAP